MSALQFDDEGTRKALDLVADANARRVVLSEYFTDDPADFDTLSGSYLYPWQAHNEHTDLPEYVMIPNTAWGDYCGGAVERSNARSLVRDFPDTFTTVTYDYSSEQLALRADQDIPEHLFDILVGLANDYPLYSDEDHSALEMELFDEDLGRWIEWDVRSAVREAKDEDCLDDVTEDTLTAWIREYVGREDANEYPYAETATSIYFDVAPCAAWIVAHKLV